MVLELLRGDEPLANPGRTGIAVFREHHAPIPHADIEPALAVESRHELRAHVAHDTELRGDVELAAASPLGVEIEHSGDELDRVRAREHDFALDPNSQRAAARQAQRHLARARRDRAAQNECAADCELGRISGAGRTLHALDARDGGRRRAGIQAASHPERSGEQHRGCRSKTAAFEPHSPARHGIPFGIDGTPNFLGIRGRRLWARVRLGEQVRQLALCVGIPVSWVVHDELTAGLRPAFACSLPRSLVSAPYTS